MKILKGIYACVVGIIKGIYNCIRKIGIFISNTFKSLANKVFTKVGVEVELEIVDEEKEKMEEALRTAEKQKKVSEMLGNTFKSKVDKNISAYY